MSNKIDYSKISEHKDDTLDVRCGAVMLVLKGLPAKEQEGILHQCLDYLEMIKLTEEYDRVMHGQ